MATIYGTGIVDTARGKLKTLMDNLITSMASGYDPKLSYVYEYHGVAYLQLNAVTIDVEGFDTGVSGITTGLSSTDIEHTNLLIFSMRVHTAYQGDEFDGLKTSRLMNSIINKLADNVNLDTYYYIQDLSVVSNNSQFDNSRSIGGEIRVSIMKMLSHTQE